MIGRESTTNDLRRRISELELERVKQERDALAAHVDQLTLALKDARLSLEHARIFVSSREKMHQAGIEGHENSITKIYLALKNTPAISLARRDAIKQAEALEEVASAIEPLSYGGTSLRNQADKLRQQANQLEID